MREWCYLLYQFDELHPEIQSRIYRSYFNFIYKDMYFLLKDHELTEDLIQEAFFKILSSIRHHKVEKTLPWIKQVSRNLAFDHLRKSKKDRYTTGIDDVNNNENLFLLGIGSLHVEDEVENKIRNERLHEAIAELQPEYRIPITLFISRKCPIRKLLICSVLLNRSSVKNYIARERSCCSGFNKSG